MRITELAAALVGDRDVPVEVTGVRPGEKTHEILVSEEEAQRTVVRGDYLAVGPILPEVQAAATPGDRPFEGPEYSSGDELLDRDGVVALLARNGLRVEDEPVFHA